MNAPIKTIRDRYSEEQIAAFRDKSLRLAVGFKRQGVGRGDRVAVQLPNWTEFPLIAAALSRIGAILVPIMPIYREDEVAYVLRHSGAVAAVTCHEFRGFGHLEMFGKLRSEVPDLRTVYVARLPGEVDASETPSLDSLMAGGDLAALEEEAGPDSSPDD